MPDVDATDVLRGDRVESKPAPNVTAIVRGGQLVAGPAVLAAPSRLGRRLR